MRTKTIFKQILEIQKGTALILAVLGTLLMSSCEKALENDPVSIYTTDVFYKSVDQVDLALTGVYDQLSQKYTYSYKMAFMITCDDDIMSWKGSKLEGTDRELAHYVGTKENEVVETTWAELYTGLNRANEFILKVSEMDLFNNGTDEEKAQLNQYLGEALFLRALYSFDLVRIWGDVPYKTTPTDLADDMFLPRMDKELIYDQIIDDLRQAQTLLPQGVPPTAERANYGSASGYLVRVLLFRAGYSLRLDGSMQRPANYEDYLQEATLEAKSIIDKGIFSLLPNWEDIGFNAVREIVDPSEVMFEVALFSIDGGSTDAGRIASYNSPKVDKKSSWNRANSYVVTVPDFIDEFDATDLRRENATANWEVNADDSIFIARDDDEYWWLGRWPKNLSPTIPGKSSNNTDVNWCLVRYGDVLLMLAEATNEIRNNLPSGVSLQDGIDAINAIRTRAGLAPLDGATTGDQAAYREAIRHERKLEMCFEGWRKYDLIRWNIMEEKVQETQARVNARYPDENYPGNSVEYTAGNNFTSGIHELYPIPLRDMDENPNLVQNPGY